MDPKPCRLDVALVARGLFDSRAKAEAAITAGLVTVDGAPARKASQKVSANADITAAPAHPWVSRAGVKLAHGLDVFGVDLAGLVCLDIGASTGGFTQVLRARGAAHVTAVDVGRGQLHADIAADLGVNDLSPKDARELTTEDLAAGPPHVIVCDASFIGLVKVIARPLALADASAKLVALFKPQFEVGPRHIGKGGVVRDTSAMTAAFDAVCTRLSEMGWPVGASCDSPITGAQGNQERLIYAEQQPD